MKEYSYGICPYKIRNGNVYILLNKTGRIGDWNFFKGKIEEGERVEECAIREFWEEAGIKYKESRLENFFYQTGVRKDVGIFLVDWDNTKKEDVIKTNEEIFTYRWVKLVPHVKTSRNQQKIYNDIILYFKGRRIPYFKEN